MKRLSSLIFTLVCAVALCACSGSEKESFGNVDHDKDGKILFEEAFFVFPDLTRKRFDGYDANADGALDLDEYVVLYASETAMAKEPKPGDEKGAHDAPKEQVKGTGLNEHENKASALDAANNPGNPDAPDAPPITSEDLSSVSLVPLREGDTGKSPAQNERPENPARLGEKETPPAAPVGQPRGAMPQPKTYTVARGDILIKIAQKFDLSVEDILKANPGLNPDNIREGQELVIPAN